MNHLEYFYKEAGMVENIFELAKSYLGFNNPIEYTSQGDPNAAAYVSQEVSKDQQGNVVDVQDADQSVKVMLQNVKNKDFGPLVEGLNMSKDEIESVFKEIGGLTQLTVEKLMENPELYEKIVDLFSKAEKLAPALRRAGEILAHEIKGHLGVNQGQELASEEVAHSKEHEGKEGILAKLNQKFPNLDNNIRAIEKLLTELPQALDKLKGMQGMAMSASDGILNDSNQNISIKSSIINNDYQRLIKISNALDLSGKFKEADLIDSILEDMCK